MLTMLMGMAFAAAPYQNLDLDGIQVAEDKATLVFMRPKPVGFAVKVAVIDHTTRRSIAEIRARSWVSAQVDPGEHLLTAWGEGMLTMKGTFEAGKVYYIHAPMKAGAWTGRQHLEPLSPGDKEWKSIPKWMKKKGWQVHEGNAQAFSDERRVDLEVALEKGLKNWSEYSEEKRAERTMNPEDGVEAPL